MQSQPYGMDDTPVSTNSDISDDKAREACGVVGIYAPKEGTDDINMLNMYI